MKRYFSFVLIGSLILVSLAVSSDQTPPSKSPSVFLPVEKYEFPPVLEGVEIRHTFLLKNRGTLPLEIIKVRTG